MNDLARTEPGSTGARLRRAFARLAVCAMLTTTIVSVLPAARSVATEPGITPVGRLDRPSETTFGANGNILIDHARRRAYQATIADDALITEIDLDTMRTTARISLPRFQPAQTAAGPMDWIWSLDRKHQRMFAFRGETPDEDTRRPNYSLLVVDLARRQPAPPKRLWPLADRIPLAVTYDAASDRLYILTQARVEIFGRSAFFLEERRPDGTLSWERERQEPACHGARDSQYAPSLWRSVIQRQFVYFNCYNQSLVQSQVVRVRIGEDEQPIGEETFPAVPGALSTMYDPGSDRLFFLTTNSGAGRGAWVFDGVRSSFLGVIASGDNRVGASDYAMGIDPVSGRLYMQTPAGFLVADARRTPLPAGLLFRQFAGFGVGLIQVDPVRHRVFVPDPKSLTDTGRAQWYVIVHDSISLSLDPTLGNPDEFTLDVPERNGVTAASYSGSAQAYGVRVLQTGGLQRSVWNVALGQFPPDDPTSPAFLNTWSSLEGLPIQSGNREIYAARIGSVSLSNDSADVDASAVRADSGTQRDLRNAGVKPRFPVLECHDAGGGAESKTGTATAVNCNVAGRMAGATAGTAAVPVEGVSISSAFAMGSVGIERGRGLVSRATGIVTGVDILHRVSIGTLRAEAETWAKGRTGTAAGRFVRAFSNVRVDANGDGTAEFTCSEQCNGAAVSAAINRALAGLAAVEFPEPDAAWYPRGSRGGYQAIVRKERFRSYSERTLNDDETVEIPAMQVVVFSDGRAGRTRHVVQLGGVQAESHYGIYLLPSASDDSRPRPTVTHRVEVPGAALPTVQAPPTPPGVSGPRTTTVLERVLRRIPAGAALAMSKPGDALRLAALWSFLLLPGYLIVRRRFLGTTRGSGA